MAKFAVIALFALVAAASAAPKPIGGIGGGVVSKNHQVSTSSHIVSPYGLGLGYGMLGYPGIVGLRSISSHSSVGHHSILPHYGLGLGGIGLRGKYSQNPDIL